MSTQEDATSNLFGIYIGIIPPTSSSVRFDHVVSLNQIQSPSSGDPKSSPIFPLTWR
jgi:hypothetical protein